MARWILKAAIQGVLSRVPAGERLNFLLQQMVRRGPAAEERWFRFKVNQCCRHLAHLREYAALESDFDVIELGTGWRPVVPLGLFLCGAASVRTIDICNHLRRSQILKTIDFFLKDGASGRLSEDLPGYKKERLGLLKSLRDKADTAEVDILREVGINQWIGDAANTNLDDTSADLIVSNSTLEHIPLDALPGILREFNRLSRPEGLMSHLIDLGDHYAYFDRRLSVYNFLRYGDLAWRILNPPLHHQNRLRISDYRTCLSKAGFEIVSEENQGSTRFDLQRVPLARRYRSYSYEDLEVTISWLVARRRAIG